MLTGTIVSLLALVLICFLFIYKKEMLIKIFAANISASTSQFTQHLEQTADVIIKRLEEEVTQLELLLDEAEIKIGMLSQQVEHANKIIEQLTELENNYRKHELEQSIVELSKEDMVSNVSSTYPVNEVQIEEPIDNGDILLDDDTSTGKEPINIEKYRHIITMSEQGYTVTEIAKVTGMGKGEIMLLLQLNK